MNRFEFGKAVLVSSLPHMIPVLVALFVFSLLMTVAHMPKAMPVEQQGGCGSIVFDGPKRLVVNEH